MPHKQDIPTLDPLVTEFQFGESLAGRLRGLWYGVAARWAIFDGIRQQNHINQNLVAHIAALRADAAQREQEILENRRLIAELSAQVVQLSRQVDQLNAN